MQNILIKILAQTKQFPALTVDVGASYLFPWNESIGAYAYAPKNQQEVDDIFLSQTLHAVWQFAPVFLDGPAVERVAPAADEDELSDLRLEVERLNALVTSATKRIEALTAEIGQPPEGSHPDEAKPRGRTWHEERANWASEVANLRQALSSKGRARNPKPEPKAPDAAPVAELADV